ncbi:hypothetical protein EYF80_056219 [Liparis tanakae]|uniref:Uncharacterized protein n=1 Tax=Liparis tanakae TaxID=230148 RepID=A0A4Z2EXT3_9TELE|nr:hypothetical protein EYF80_056219 [Liparis tanakae]
MCSLRLRSATDREISISDICNSRRAQRRPVRGAAVMFPGLFRRFPGAVLVGFEVQIDVSLGRHVRSSEARNQKKGSYERRRGSQVAPGENKKKTKKKGAPESPESFFTSVRRCVLASGGGGGMAPHRCRHSDHFILPYDVGAPDSVMNEEL